LKVRVFEKTYKSKKKAQDLVEGVRRKNFRSFKKKTKKGWVIYGYYK
jgi:hypothetical protein